MEKIKENTINFEKVFTREDFSHLSDEEVALAKKEGTYHANYLRRAFSGGTLVDLLGQRSRELAFLSHKYREQSDATKELLAATIAFPDDEKFIRALLAKNINYYQLFSYSRAITSIKRVTMFAKELEADDSIKVVNKKLNHLCIYIRNYFGIRDFNLILAKINEIVTFQKDLYKKLEDEQISQTKTKKL